MEQARRHAFLVRWARNETVYEPPSEEPLTRSPPERVRQFERAEHADPHNDNFNYILDGRIRVTPVGSFHWDENHALWVGYGERWNRFSKTWSPPRLFHCREFECENNTMSTI